MPAPVANLDWHRVAYNACGRKVPFRNLDDAVSARPSRLHRVYRCPFDRRHWHVGRVPNMRVLRELATAIRSRAQDPSA